MKIGDLGKILERKEVPSKRKRVVMVRAKTYLSLINLLFKIYIQCKPFEKFSPL